LPAGPDIGRFFKSFTFEEKNGSRPAVKTEIEEFAVGDIKTTFYVNEFWTSRQRQAASIHEISYRACFKPQLPRFFIELLTDPGELVYDPFAGRGTTTIEAALLGRKPIANDINPLSRILSEPRLAIPSIDQVRKRLAEISFQVALKNDLDLSMFYHPQTEAELLALRIYLAERREKSLEDAIDRWIRMVATNRLSGHSKGFFSVYTMPPNQAVSAERQVKLNIKRGQKPDYRDVRSIILKKSGQLMRNLSDDQRKILREASKSAVFLEKDAADTKSIPGGRVDLTVTSPPFLDVVQYSQDNWLRCWFNNISLESLKKQLTMAVTPGQWSSAMGPVFNELYRITRPGGWVAFEVGEVRVGRIKLEEQVIPLGLKSGFQCAGVVVNRQNFTKTSNIWGVKNNHSGTNSNRIVLFNKKITG
jgi:hypothetical protein